MTPKQAVEVAAVGGKAFNLSSESQREAYWRSFETAREPFEAWLNSKVQHQFQRDAGTIKFNLNAEESPQSVMWDHISGEWYSLLANAYRHVGRAFAHRTLQALPRKADALSIRHKDSLTDTWLEAIEEYIAEYVGERVTQIVGTTKDLIKAAIQAGIDNGEGVYDIRKRVESAMGNVSRARSERIARTETVSAANHGSMAAAEAAGLKLEKHWLSTKDNRVRDTHATADGQVRPMNEPFEVGGAELMFPGDGSLGAPGRELVNCFPADTVVWSDAVEKAYGRHYEGELVEITTSLGDKLTGTPNHPVLTDRGWLPLDAISEGDNVLSCRFAEHVSSRWSSPDVYQVPSEIGQIFDALSIQGGIHRVACLQVDFHGDGIPDSDIEVVPAYGKLRDRLHPITSEPVAELGLACSDFDERPLLVSRDIMCPGVSTALASERSMGCLGERSSLFGAGLRHSKIHALGSSARADPGVRQQATDDVAGNIEVSGDSLLGPSADVEPHGFLGDVGVAVSPADSLRLSVVSGLTTSGNEPVISATEGYAEAISDVLETLPGFVQFADVTQVRRVSFSGQVYNLQTRNGWYSANNIIAHNCRCTVTFSVVK